MLEIVLRGLRRRAVLRAWARGELEFAGAMARSGRRRRIHLAPR